MAYVIMAVPADTPVTTPLVNPTVATAGSPLVQRPVGVGSDTVIVPPTHITVGPVIGAGDGLTVTVVNTVRPGPVPIEYVITAVPGVTPHTSPVEDPIVATAGLVLLHVPPPTPSVSV